MIDAYSMFCARLNDSSVFSTPLGREPIEIKKYCDALSVRLTDDFRGQVVRPIGIARTPILITGVSLAGVKGFSVELDICGVRKDFLEMERLESYELSSLTTDEEEALRKYFRRESEIANYFPRSA